MADEQALVYFIGSVISGPIKIGTTTGLAARLADLQVGHPFPLRVLGTEVGDFEVERAAHLTFASDRLAGEWFRPSVALLRRVLASHRRTGGDADWQARVSRLIDAASSCEDLRVLRLAIHGAAAMASPEDVTDAFAALGGDPVRDSGAMEFADHEAFVVHRGQRPRRYTDIRDFLNHATDEEMAIVGMGPSVIQGVHRCRAFGPIKDAMVVRSIGRKRIDAIKAVLGVS